MSARCHSALALFVALPAVAADPIKVGTLSAPAPADWKAEKPTNRLRSYQFKLPGEPPAEVIVMPDSNPDPAKSFPRWKESFVPPDDGGAVGKESKFESAGATVHVLDAAGTWKYKERPFDPKSKEELREGYRVVWVIVAEKESATHVRLSGPKEVVDRHYPAFRAWVMALK
jgi:hypothetical protein